MMMKSDHAPMMEDLTGEVDIKQAKVLFTGVLNLALIILISVIVWFVLFSPNGYVRLYTPNVGLSLVITILLAIHWGVDIWDYWPFNKAYLEKASPLSRGFILTAFYCLSGFVIMFVVYEQVIGRFGLVFFSGSMLLAGGGLGQYAQTATENACFAQVMMNTSIIFCTILWITAFRFGPWREDKPLARSLGVFIGGLLLAILAFSFLFYPHIAYQFYPPQKFMAVMPWWRDMAMTLSSVFHFGWIVPALVLCYWSKLLWEGLPWSLIKNPFWRGLCTVCSVVVLGIIVMFATNTLMDWWWGTEAFEGGAILENPAWRWNHVAEMAMFCQVAAVVLSGYFGNWPNDLPRGMRAIIRTLLAIGGGLLLAWLYYEAGPMVLGTVPGIGQDGDTSLAWTVMLLILLYSHQEFFKGFPFSPKRSS